MWWWKETSLEQLKPLQFPAIAPKNKCTSDINILHYAALFWYHDIVTSGGCRWAKEVWHLPPDIFKFFIIYPKIPNFIYFPTKNHILTLYCMFMCDMFHT